MHHKHYERIRNGWSYWMLSGALQTSRKATSGEKPPKALMGLWDGVLGPPSFGISAPIIIESNN